MKKTTIYITITNEDNYLTIDGNLELLNQFLTIVFPECNRFTRSDQNTDPDPANEEKFKKE